MIAFIVGMGVVLVEVINPVAQLSEPTKVMGLVSLVWYLVLVASTLLPLVIPPRRWGWLGQVATSRRVDVLEARRDRLRQVSDAAVVDTTPERTQPQVTPRRRTGWFAIILRRGT
ncbi:hypothetical protein [Microbacterium sp. RU33B]|uniref:hypothetical protein n=1 Tax=Microbacterium sp. RU33B TaxID=1907390 RepID=UPI0009597823|nr:hypothetical protein [Microbacterium sp. RU33B]SIT72462.1 hypothetical protein SAMN05880545_1057 [Microbacterium sp. RU33B]